MNGTRAKLIRQYVLKHINKHLVNRYYGDLKRRWERAGPMERRVLAEDMKADRVLRPPPAVTPRQDLVYEKARRRKAQRLRRAAHATA